MTTQTEALCHSSAADKWASVGPCRHGRCIVMLWKMWCGEGPQTQKKPCHRQGSLRFPRTPASNRVGDHHKKPKWANIGQPLTLPTKILVCCKWVTPLRGAISRYHTILSFSVPREWVLASRWGPSFPPPAWFPPKQEPQKAPASPSGAFYLRGRMLSFNQKAYL